MNKLLARQLKKHYGSVENIPDELKTLFSEINNTYESFNVDTQLLQNSIEISSQELRDAYQKQKIDVEKQKETINKIKAAIYALNPTPENTDVDVEDPSDSIYLFDSLIKLIEERKEAEEILKLSKAVEQNPASIIITDIKGDIEYVNPKFCDLTGYKKEEAVGKNPRFLNSGSNPSEYFITLWETILSGKEWRGELQNKKKNGELYWESISILPIINDQKNITHFIAIKEDITERREMEQQLKESEILQRSLLENIAVGIMIIDPVTRIIELVNTFAAQLIGESECNIVGNRCHQYICPALEHACPVCDKGQDVDNSEKVLLCADKTELSVLNTVKRIKIGGKEKLVESFVDITLQKNAQEAFRQSSQKFEAIISASPDGIGMASLDGKLELMSDKLAAMYGYSVEQKDQYIDKTIFDFIDPSNHDILRENIRKLLEGGSEHKITEYLAIKQDGSRFYVDVNSTILYDALGKPTSILFIERNITDRKIVEEELLQSTKKLEAIIAASPDGIGMASMDGKIELMSEKLALMHGYTIEKKEEYQDKTIFDFIHPSNHELLKENIQKLVSGNKEHKIIEYRALKKNNTSFYSDVNSTILLDSHGNPGSILFVERDITERKQFEENLKTSEENFRTFFSSIADLLFVLDGYGNILDVNNTVLERLEYSKEELIKKSVLLIHPEQRREETAHNVEEMLAGARDFCPVPVLTKSGVEIQVETRVYPGVWDGKPALFGVVKDVTKIKQSEEKFSKAFQSSSNLMAISTASTGHYIDVNDMFLEVLEYTRNEVIGFTSQDLDIFEDYQQREFTKSILVENGFAKDIEVKIRTKSGKILTGLFSASSIIIGEDSCWLTTMTDITERKLAEQEIKRHSALISSLLDSIPDIIFFKDENGVYLGGNPAFAEFSNLPKDKIIGFTDYDLFDKEFADQFRKQDLQVIESKKPIHNDVWMTYPNGGKVLFDNLKTPYFGPDGSLIGVLGISRDMTDRKLAEDSLNQISTRLALATRAGGVGVWDFDIVNNIYLWDDQMFALYGVGPEEKEHVIAYDIWQSRVHVEDVERGNDEVKMAIQGEKEFDTEFRVVWPDGSIHNIRALATVQRDKAGNPLRMIGTNWDITEQKKTEATLYNAMQEAEMANKSKSLFLANMSHEIRTPLNAIIGFSQLISRDKLLSDSQKEYNLSIIRASEHLLELINDILELSKVEAGRVVLNPTNVDLHSLFDDIQMIFKERAQSKHIQFMFEIDENLPQYVVVDESKLRQIFVNLIGNAIKFTDEGGIAVRACVDKIDMFTDKLIVEIQDSGPGIEKSELNELFKHFVQTSAGIKKGSGTGLGLVLSRELAVLMGGDISVSSKVGKGSVFTFHLEVKEGKPEVYAPCTTKRVICIDEGEPTYRILVVDDKVENMKVVVNLLKLVGFETNEAVNGQDAIEKFEELSPDLILMDMRMPIMDGYEATKRIKSTEKGKRTPIVALTASAFEEEQEKAESIGMQGYIRKPFRESELFNTIGKVLGIKYVYETEVNIKSRQERYLNDDETIVADIDKLPNKLISGMLNAVSVADLDLLLELIKSIEPDNIELAKYLTTLANNYDYDYLQQILSKGLK
ncbi:MAG: PAS domain S-box protein [Bacteroidota bacterium]